MADAVQPQKLSLRNALTRERLAELLHYDLETGIFTWRVRRTNKARPGSRAGYMNRLGYYSIDVDKVGYLAHRLAWLYVNKEWPEADIDHINCIRSDNRIINLRKASRSQNRCNTKFRRSKNMKGAYRCENGKWRSHIVKNGTRIYLGVFISELEAHAAYCAAADRLHGEFARTVS
jgi:hypothetical protein